MSTMDYLEFKSHLEHSFTQKDKAEYYKNKDMNNIRVSRERLELAGRANTIKALVKQRDQKNEQLNSLYRDMERSGVSSTKTNSQQSSVANGKRNKLENEIVALDNEILSKSKDLISVIGMPMFERFMKGTSLPTDVSYKLSHDNLEHGWFTDLFKKSYTVKGSTAGMPTNLPRTATSGGSAGSKQLVYSDQLRKLNNNLVEYELKMNQAKASYEEYRKLYNDTKKNIANTEKALNEATKEAARTGFDPSKSSVAPPARRYASSNAILPQTTITGSTEGLKKTRYHVKKKK